MRCYVGINRIELLRSTCKVRVLLTTNALCCMIMCAKNYFYL
jgi:hypothetical protein